MLSDRKAPAPRTVHSARARRELLLAAVADAPFTPVQELSDRFGVSAVTVRSDLRYLEARGRLRRVRGGAVPMAVPRPGRGDASRSPAAPAPVTVGTGPGSSPTMNAVGELAVVPAVHPALATLAARLVEPGDVLGLDASPVGAETAAALTRRVLDGELADLTVLTPSVVVAAVLSTAATIRTRLPGGGVSWPSGALDGTFDAADGGARGRPVDGGCSLALLSVHLRGDGRLVLSDGSSRAVAQLAGGARRVVAVLAAGGPELAELADLPELAELPELPEPDLVLTDLPPDSAAGRLLAQRHRAVLRPDVAVPERPGTALA